ncbi:MAG: alanine racemase [Ruminococcus sp.]|nr:alanine racemase [Ruminococcus sp.]
MLFTRRLWAEINMDAAISNYHAIKEKIGEDTKICCVVKADGYGHGAVELAKLYSELNCDYFAVSNLDEALELRDADIKEPIVILGYTPANRCEDLSKYNISQAVYGLDYAKMLSDECVKAGVKCKIHIKCDTGMSRLGFMCQQFPRDDYSIEEIRTACTLPNLVTEGIFTHFAVADECDEGRDFTRQQYNAFTHTVDALKKQGIAFEVTHCSNSGAILDHADMKLDMVRAGIILYGLAPSDKLKDKLNLEPIMRLKTMVSYVKEIKKGTTVSYGRTFTAQRDMKIATVPVGYADGYIRAFAKDGYMFIKGQKAKIIGRICMDQTLLDVTDIEGVEIGNVCVLFGNGRGGEPTPDDVAKWGNTINYEIVCSVSKRVPRLYRRDGVTVEVMYKI